MTKVLKDDVRKALSESGTLDEITESVRAAWQVHDQMDYGSRAKAAEALIERLVPTEVDVKLWRDLALGRNVRPGQASLLTGLTGFFPLGQHVGIILGLLLAEARSRKAALEEGVKVFAATCLLTQMRKATTPLFAVGPAWTILRAIAGSSGKEVQPGEQANETQRIMVVLHALCEFEPFGISRMPFWARA